MISNETASDLMYTKEQMDLKRKETLESVGKLCLLDDNLMTLVFDRNYRSYRTVIECYSLA